MIKECLERLKFNWWGSETPAFSVRGVGRRVKATHHSRGLPGLASGQLCTRIPGGRLSPTSCSGALQLLAISMGRLGLLLGTQGFSVSCRSVRKEGESDLELASVSQDMP